MCVNDRSCSGDLDLDLVTSVCEHDLDILKPCQRTKNEVYKSTLSNVRARTGRQTDTERQTDASTQT